MLVLDSGAVSELAKGSTQVRALIAVLTIEGLWPPVVPSAVLAECLTGRPGDDARTNRLLKGCEIATRLDVRVARHAARLRTQARRGSAIDAIVVASADPGGTVLTGDVKDITALASQAADVTVWRL